MDTQPFRVIIRVGVADIPGNRLARSHRLGRDFCSEVLGRELKEQQAGGFDHVHILPNFDSINPVKAWFLFDFNATEQIDRPQLSATIPHRVYHATRLNDSWIFTPRDHWIDTARKYCLTYNWGGKKPSGTVGS
ncbi:hypothetical protein DL95DRAFT_444131 [Leptodontidium sp. 2 PMI_412]|nr:hypothetical protein DL95DRAFT_444131 [Leptodontidium sp. 2 PMI_412]